MADLDQQIADQIATLQTQGAGRAEIELRFQELNAWALQRCLEQDERSLRPASAKPTQTAEQATLQRLWHRLEQQVAEAASSGIVVSYLAIMRCEDGQTIILVIDSDDDMNQYIASASESFWLHFNPAAWIGPLTRIAEQFSAECEVIDVVQQHILDDQTARLSGWRRVI